MEASSSLVDTATSSPSTYEVDGNMIDYGKKNIVVRSPRALKQLIDAHLQWTPIANYKSRSRGTEDKNDVVTWFDIKLKDEHFRPAAGEAPKLYDVHFLLPSDFAELTSADAELGVAQLDVSVPRSQQYVAELNDLLKCWLPIMTQRAGDSTVVWNDLATPTLNFKWPWQKVSVSDYFENFSADLHVHKLLVGVGYHSGKTGKMGITLALSNFPGLTRRGAMVARKKQNDTNSKKRKMTALDENGNELPEQPSADESSK